MNCKNSFSASKEKGRVQNKKSAEHFDAWVQEGGLRKLLPNKN